MRKEKAKEKDSLLTQIDLWNILKAISAEFVPFKMQKSQGERNK